MSNYIKEECIKVGIPDSKIYVIPYFTLPVQQQPMLQSRHRKLLYVGRLGRIKGVHTMIDSLEPLFTRYSDLQLDIIGDGPNPYKSDLVKMVEDKKLSDRIHFHGWLGRNQINDALRDCYMLVFPSIYPEAFGISGIEAMMHSKPVVAFATGGVGHWLKDGETGLSVGLNNKQDFRESVERLLNDFELKLKLGEQARLHTMRMFNPEKHINKLLNVYRSSLVNE
jgi:glycosyltransferase involved in cell wall biosynthesis